MTLSLKLYGFGSHFAHAITAARDVDLLLVHQDVTRASMKFAICCKSLIVKQVPKAHVVMLSETEEYELGFLNQSGARFLEVISQKSMHVQIHQLVQKIA